MPGMYSSMTPDAGQIERDEADRLATQDRLAIQRPVPAGEKLALDTERDYYREGQLSRKDQRDIDRRLAAELAKSDERNKRMFGDRYKVVDLREQRKDENMWGQAAEQAQARDAAHDARQKGLMAEAAEAAKKGDHQAADVSRLEAMHDQKRYESAVWSDCQGKELSIRPDTEGRINEHALELQAEATKASQSADRLGDRLAIGKDMLSRRENHQDRQQAYADLSAYAKDQGAGRASEFLDKYKVYKEAQYAERLSHVRGNPDDMKAATEKLAEARSAAITAKGDLKLKELSSLSAAYRARMDNPRLFTKPEANQQTATQDQAAKVTRPMKIPGRPYKDSRVEALQAIKAQEQANPAKAKETNPMDRIRTERQGRADQLKAVYGADADPEFIKTASQRRGNFESAMSKTDAGKAVLAENAQKVQAAKQTEEQQTAGRRR